MPPSYQGAKEAIKARIAAAGLTVPAGLMTPAGDAIPGGGVVDIGFENGPDPKRTTPEQDDKPWAYFEVQDAGSDQRGIGAPGNQLWQYSGLIVIHVFVPVRWGDEVAGRIADAAGEVFRAKRFYADVPGYEVKTWGVSPVDGGDGADDGQWWRETRTIRFDYWHRG